MNKKPNIILIFTDDQRFDTIAALGNEVIQTPNMDFLVRNGTSFTRAYIPGGTEAAVCMPSRAMLHTGRTLFHLQGNGEEIPEDHTLLGEHLNANGYHTWATGKWHNGKSAFNRSFEDGAEIMFGGMADHWNVPAFNYDSFGEYSSKIPMIQTPSKTNVITWRQADHIPSGVHSSELFADSACQWLSKYKSNDPYFMYVSFMAPHDPRTMPQEFLEMYKPEDIELPRNFASEYIYDHGVGGIRDELLAKYPRDANEVKRHLAEYYGMITHLDAEIGKIIQKIKDRGEFENTLFIFAGDNGLALGQHGLMGKQSSYDHSVHVPLIFAGSGIPKNETRDGLCYLLDIFPTLCEILEIDTPESVEGKSLYSCIQNTGVHRDALYFAYESKTRAIQTETHKLILYNNKGEKHEQLFNSITDPDETNNLIHDEPNLAKELKDRMLKLKSDWENSSHPSTSKFWE